MHFDFKNPKPSEELVAQVGPVLANHLTAEAVKNEKPQLFVAQTFQEEVVARQNQRGAKGCDGIGQCVARVDVGLFLRIQAKHKLEIAADSKKFWLVTAPRLYPNLGIKPVYQRKPMVTVGGELQTA
jgi:hypothetical protein